MNGYYTVKNKETLDSITGLGGVLDIMIRTIKSGHTLNISNDGDFCIQGSDIKMKVIYRNVDKSWDYDLEFGGMSSFRSGFIDKRSAFITMIMRLQAYVMHSNYEDNVC